MNVLVVKRRQTVGRMARCAVFAALCIFFFSLPARASSAGPNGINIGFDFNWNSGPAGYSASFLDTTSASGTTLDNCRGPVTSTTSACNFVFSYDIGGIAQNSVSSGGVYSNWSGTCDANPGNSAPLTLFNCFNSNSFGQIFMAGATGTLSNFNMSMTCLNPSGQPITGAVALLYQLNSDGISIPATPIAQAPLDLSSCPTSTSWSGHQFSAADFAPIPMNFSGVTLTAGNFYGVYFAYPLQWLTVTTLADQTDAGATCTGDTCSLRDAIALVDQESAGAITGINFQSGLMGTINLQSGLTLTGNALIQGPGANLVTVSGGGTSSNFSVITINSGVGLVSISGLTIANGNSSNGGGIDVNGGMLTVSGSAFSGNSTTGEGGAIYNNGGGELTASNSTFSGNSATGEGGAIYNNGGALSVTNSTFSGNSSASNGSAIYNINDALTATSSTISGNSALLGGGIYNSSGTLTLANSVISGDTANSTPDDIDGSTYVDLGGNIIGYANGSSVNGSSANLSALGNYGGPTQTLVPLPGSPALCAGLSANIPSGDLFDQRGTGFSRTNTTYTGYSAGSPCVDAGAVQAQYAMSFTTQPANVDTAAVMTSSAVTLTESGTSAGFASSGTVTVSDADSYLSSTATGSATLSSGVATFNNLLFSMAADSDSLTATLPLTSFVTLTANSSTFDILALTSQTISFAQPTSPITYGSTVTVPLSATGGGSGNPVTFGVASGPGSISGSTLTITGAGAIVISANQAGNASYAAAPQMQKSLMVNPASSTLTGPATQPVQVVYGQAGSVPVTLTGQYSGAGIATPSGTISYSVSGNAFASGTAAISNGAAAIPVPSTVAPGTYTVTVSYGGDENYNAATSIPISLQAGQIQPTINWAQPGAITYGTSLAGVLNASAVNGSNPVPGTYSYLNGATAVSASTVLPAGTYTLTVNFTPTDTTTYKTATANVGLAVNQALVGGVTLTSTVNPVLVMNTTTLVATVSSAVSTPTGSVSFFDGTSSTPLGTATLSGGIAQLPVSTLAAGTHSITAVYSGNANFLGATSAALSEQVQDFNLTISTGASPTVTPGGTANYSFTLTPTGTTFPSAVTLSVSGLPTGATATLTPQTLPAGSSLTNVTLTIQLPSQTAALQKSGPFGRGMLPMALALLLLPFSRKMRRSAGRLGRVTALLLLLMAGAAGIAGLTGCGSSTGYFGQPQQTYNVIVTATSGALTHSTTVTLTVQ